MALKSRTTEPQVIKAIEVGIEMGGGHATVSSRFALVVLEYYKIKYICWFIIKNFKTQKVINPTNISE